MRDRAWIRLMVSGDKVAGEQFVREYYVRVERMLRCLTGSPDIARDLTQQTFVKAWQGLPDFKGRSSLATWLHKIAYHEYTHWLRDRRDHAPLETAMNVADAPIINDWGLVLLPDALAQLSEELRDAFLLYHVQELSIAEVADVLEVPRGTVKSRLFTARQQLRAILQTSMREPETNQTANAQAGAGVSADAKRGRESTPKYHAEILPASRDNKPNYALAAGELPAQEVQHRT